MKIVNIILSVFIFLLAGASAYFSFELWNKRSTFLDGWKNFATAINSAANAIDADSGSTYASSLTGDELNHLKYKNLEAKLAEFNEMNQKLIKERNDLADALHRIGAAVGARNLPAKADFRKFTTYSQAMGRSVSGVSDLNNRHRAGMNQVTRHLRQVGIHTNAEKLLNNDAGTLNRLGTELNRIGQFKNEYEKAIRAIAGENGVRGLNFGTNFRQDAQKAVQSAQQGRRDRERLMTNLNAANREIARLKNDVNVRNQRIKQQEAAIQLKEKQLGELKVLMKIDNKDDIPRSWKKGSTEARMAIYGKVIEVNTEYGYVGLSVGKGTRVYQQLGPARSVEIDPVIVTGMELKIYRGLLEGGKVNYVGTVKLNKVNDDCSIANLPPGADIQVGDSICFELTDANAALKK